MRAELFLTRDHGTRLHFARRHRVQGCLQACIGIWLLAAAVGALVAGGAWLILAAFTALLGLLFFVGGLGTVVRVDDVVLDAAGGTLWERRGRWPRARWTEGPLDLVDSVVRTVELRAVDDEDTRTVHLLTLGFKDDRDPIVIQVAGGPVETNQLHERLAGFLGVVAVDRTGTRETRRDPDELDLSLAERVARDREKGSGADGVERDPVPLEPIQRVPLPPLGSSISLEETHQGTKITLPRLYSALEILFAGAGGLIALVIVVQVARSPIPDPDMSFLGKLFLGLVALFCAWVAGLMLQHIFLPRVIEDRGDRLHLSRSFRGRAVAHSELPKAAIEMVDRKDESVRIRTDDEVHRVGRYLNREALEWLEQAVTVMAVRRE